MQSLQITIDPDVRGLTNDHTNFRDAVAELLADLRDVPELSVEERARSSAGVHKGSFTSIEIALIAASGLNGLVRILHLWVSRDRHRRLRIKRSVDGLPSEEIVIEGDNTSVDLIRDALRHMELNDHK